MDTPFHPNRLDLRHKVDELLPRKLVRVHLHANGSCGVSIPRQGLDVPRSCGLYALCLNSSYAAQHPRSYKQTRVVAEQHHSAFHPAPTTPT